MGKQPIMGQKKSKDAIAKAAMASRKTSKKKWSKGKEKEKKEFGVFVTSEQFKDLLKELPKMRLITPAIISERFKIVLSVAKQAIRYLAGENKIKALDKQTR
jgi:small subunit ribosomal protein S25e